MRIFCWVIDPIFHKKKEKTLGYSWAYSMCLIVGASHMDNLCSFLVVVF